MHYSRGGGGGGRRGRRRRSPPPAAAARWCRRPRRRRRHDPRRRRPLSSSSWGAASAAAAAATRTAPTATRARRRGRPRQALRPTAVATPGRMRVSLEKLLTCRLQFLLQRKLRYVSLIGPVIFATGLLVNSGGAINTTIVIQMSEPYYIKLSTHQSMCRRCLRIVLHKRWVQSRSRVPQSAIHPVAH